jgi:hypothetical protein
MRKEEREAIKNENKSKKEIHKTSSSNSEFKYNDTGK